MRRRRSAATTRSFGSVMGEDTVEEPAARLCLEPCPRCRAAKFSGGACHLPSVHAGSHELSRGERRDPPVAMRPAACVGW
jgi:hypothetical protein